MQFAARFTPRAAEVQIDGAVLAFSLAATVLHGPRRRDRCPASPAFERLARAARRRTAAPPPAASRQRLRSALAVSQLALSFMLLIGAALMLRSFAKLQQVDAGFRAQNVLTMTVDLNWSKYSTPERRVDREQVPEGLRAALGAGARACPAS